MYDFVLPTEQKDHTRLIALVAILVIIIVVGSVVAWFLRGDKQKVAVEIPQISKTDQVASLLRRAPVVVPVEQINAVANLLAKTKDTSQTQKDTVASMLSKSK